MDEDVKQNSNIKFYNADGTESDNPALPTGDASATVRIDEAKAENRWVEIGEPVEYAEEWQNLLIGTVNGLSVLSKLIETKPKEGVKPVDANDQNVDEETVFSGSLAKLSARLEAVYDHLNKYEMVADDETIPEEVVDRLGNVAQKLLMSNTCAGVSGCKDEILKILDACNFEVSEQKKLFVGKVMSISSGPHYIGKERE